MNCPDMWIFSIFLKLCLTNYCFMCIISLVFAWICFSHFHFNTYARVAQWWSTSLPRRGSRVRSPSRALLDKKRTFPDWEVLFCYPRSAMHFSNSYCWSSMGSISQCAKALFGRANAEVHRTSWHPSRALLDKKRGCEKRLVPKKRKTKSL